MEGKLNKIFEAPKERKRKRDEFQEAFSVLRSASLHDLTEMDFASSDDIITVLSAKFGWRTVFVVGRLMSVLPSVISRHLEEKILAGMVGELTRTITKDELRVIIDLLRRCEDFLEFSYENSVSTIAINAAIPIQRILYPPIQLCLRCGWTLQLQSQPAIVTVFENHETFPGMKFSLKCRNCNIHYGYSMYGSGEDGYRFYAKRRPYVESSNVTYLARDLCLQQICLA